MNNKNVLIVEDESIVALEISTYVKELGYEVVDAVSRASKALEVVNEKQVDAVLMDVNLKGDVDGIECASEIKKHKDIPIIYITAFSDDETLERAILTDPSSYLTKPFRRESLRIALKVALKNGVCEVRVGDVLFDNEFSFDTNMQELIMLGEFIHMTRQEKELLSLLVKSKNSIVSIYEMENFLWPDKESNENTRRALVSRLRAKLKYKFLETIHSIGYRINI